jgi:hypothetical protein
MSARPLACTAKTVHDDRPAVEQDRAGAAVGRVAADMSPREPEDLADQMDEEQPRRRRPRTSRR